MQFKYKCFSILILIATICAFGMQDEARNLQPSNQESQDYDGYSETYITCMKSAGDDVIRDDACKSSELKYQDAKLNKIYKELIIGLKPDAKNALIAAEKNWVQLKSANADFESILYGGAQIDNAQRLTNDLLRTKARAQELDKYLNFIQIVGN